MKKSLVEAIVSARTMSEKHPEIRYCVLDKKMKRSEVHSDLVPWMIRDAILDGWHEVIAFKAGEAVN